MRRVSVLAAAVNRDRKVSASAQENDWPSLAGFAIRHGLGPLLYHSLRNFAGDQRIPADVFDALRQVAGYTMVHVGRILQDINSVLRALADADIRCLALKGPHLATAFYPHPGLRPMGDLDVLVPCGQLDTAFHLLLQQGYSPVHPVPRKLLHHHLPVLVKPGAVPVELHWTIVPRGNAFKIDIEGMWERARPSASPVLRAEVLDLEDLLLHLCLHSTYNHRCRVALRNIVDIMLVIHHGHREVDWERLVEYARLAHVENAVSCGLLLANELFSADTPPRIMEYMAPGVNRDMILGYATPQLARFDLAIRTRQSALHLQQPLGKRSAKLLSRAVPVWRELTVGASDWIPLFRTALKFAGRGFKAMVQDRRLVWGLLRSRPDARAHLDAARKSIWLENWLEARPDPHSYDRSREAEERAALLRGSDVLPPGSGAA